jgi:hypothetical protein
MWMGTAYACTILPSINLSQAYGAPGATLQLSGTAWQSTSGVVTVHWDGITGPVLATTSPDAQGVLAPVSLTVPAGAAPGYHVIVSSVPDQSVGVSRAVYQVVGAGGVPAAQPGAVLPGGAPPVQHSAGVGTLVLLLGAGVGGVGLFGAGTASLIRSSRRQPVPVPLRRR